MEAAAKQIRLRRIATYKYNHSTRVYDLVVKEESDKPKIVIDVKKDDATSQLIWDERETYNDVGHIYKRYHWSRDTGRGPIRYELNMIAKPHKLERFKGDNKLPYAYEEYVQVL